MHSRQSSDWGGIRIGLFLRCPGITILELSFVISSGIHSHKRFLSCSLFHPSSNSDDSHSDSMNLDVQEYTPIAMQSPPCVGRAMPKAGLLGEMIPSLLLNRGGLGMMPSEMLRENLQPIVEALKKLDAEVLLGLDRTAKGPRVREG